MLRVELLWFSTENETPGALGWWEPLAWVMFFSYVGYFTNFIV